MRGVREYRGLLGPHDPAHLAEPQLDRSRARPDLVRVLLNAPSNARHVAEDQLDNAGQFALCQASDRAVVQNDGVVWVC